VTSRFRIALLVGMLALAGCDDAQWNGPIPYRDSERFAKDLAGKPTLQELTRKALAKHFGDDLRKMRVPEGSSLREDGLYLANFVRTGDERKPVLEVDPKTGQSVPIAGGYALYRRNCLHCHGVFGGGDGPTSAYLYPRPRDYRPGIYKFTSTNPVNAKPTRADLRKTILYGLHGTSMPGFEALMSASEIEQVIDYMTFLSMRGETEKALIDEAMTADDKDAPNTLDDDTVKEILDKVVSSWKDAETLVVNPSSRRVESTPESIKRGRDLYLGANTSGSKLECVGCHGASGKGDGGAFIDQEIFRDAALRFYPFDEAVARFHRAEKEKAATHAPTKPAPDPAGVSTFLRENEAVIAYLQKERGLRPFGSKEGSSSLEPAHDMVTRAREIQPALDDPAYRALLLAKMELWKKSLDEWGNPLRPANLIEGTYKGGRRPLDLYWRIAKGINGVKMPAHAGLLTDDQIWDVVNFVLAVPQDPDLLPESAPAPAKPHALATSH
jgi:mono/diheme cytochrome c family protein